MSKVIAYSVIRMVVVGVPFTWGTRNAWAIKVESGGMYYLSNGKKVLETEEGGNRCWYILCRAYRD